MNGMSYRLCMIKYPLGGTAYICYYSIQIWDVSLTVKNNGVSFILDGIDR